MALLNIFNEQLEFLHTFANFDRGGNFQESLIQSQDTLMQGIRDAIPLGAGVAAQCMQTLETSPFS
eukprot:6964579-Karenia_brevis.AAC.1